MLTIIIILAVLNVIELASIGVCLAILHESYIQIKDASALLPVSVCTKSPVELSPINLEELSNEEVV